jgi:hypothetical protein
MNRQPTEEDLTIADALQEIKLLISQQNITDEDFQVKVKEILPKIKNLIQEIEEQY